MSPRGADPIALSILIGSGLIALGLFFGLRARGPVPEAPSRAVSPIASPAGSSEPAQTANPPGNPDVQAPRLSERDLAVQLNEQARMSLEKHRRLMLDKCWLPKTGGRGQSLYRYLITVNAAGQETKRQIDLVANAESREDVLLCLRKLPGTEVSVEPRDKEGIASFEMPFP